MYGCQSKRYPASLACWMPTETVSFCPMWFKYLEESGNGLSGLILHAGDVLKEPEQRTVSRIHRPECDQDAVELIEQTASITCSQHRTHAYTRWPNKWEHESECQLNDLRLYSLMPLMIDGVIVCNLWLQITTDTLNILLRSFDNFSDNFVAPISNTLYVVYIN